MQKWAVCTTTLLREHYSPNPLRTCLFPREPAGASHPAPLPRPLPTLSQPGSCDVSMSSAFAPLSPSPPASQALRSLLGKCRYLLRKRRKYVFCHTEVAQGAARLSSGLKSFPASQPRGLATVTRTRFAVVLAQTFGVCLPWIRKETSAACPLLRPGGYGSPLAPRPSAAEPAQTRLGPGRARALRGATMAAPRRWQRDMR